MTNNATDTEYLIAQKAAKEYRSKGYEVTLAPKLDFLRGMTPDLLASRGDERIVVEVKSRSSLAADRRVAEMARIIAEKPGWSFDLVLVAEPEKLDSPEGARSFEHDEILRTLEAAERLIETGLPDAAFVIAWSACEAGIRARLAELGVQDSDITTPLFTLDRAVFEGVLSREEYQVLNRMLPYRNAFVHGFQPGEFDPAMTADLIAFARRIADPASVSDSVE